MINTRLLKTTLMAASAAIALTAVPMWADEEDSGDSTTSTAWGDGDGVAVSDHTYSGDIVINYDDFTGITASNAKTITPDSGGNKNEATLTGDGYQGSWLMFTDATSTTTSRTVTGTVSGTGFFGITFLNSTGNAATIDLTGLSSSSFSGQLMVANAWASPFTVEIGGDWSGSEFVFEGVSREWWDKDEDSTHTNAYGDGTDADKGFYAIASVAQSATGYEVETLQLSSNTSFAGITGTSEGYSLTGPNGDVALNAREFITAASSGTVLTLTGSGEDTEYAFYGTVGSSSIALDIAKTGTATQTFGGTNYLGNVTVSAGTLVLGTLSVTSNDTTISGSGTITATEIEVGSTSNARKLTVGDGDVATTVTTGSVSIHGTSGEISIASGSTLAVTGDIAFSAGTGYTDYITGAGTLTADTFTLSGAGNFEIGVANATIGTITSSTGHTITISEGSTVTTGAFSRTGGVLVLDVNGTLNVTSSDSDSGTGLLSYGTAAANWCGNSQTLSGSGTVNAEGIHFWSNASSTVALNITVANLNIGATGFVLDNQGQFTLSGTTVGIIEGTNSVSIATKLTLNEGTTTFNPTSDKTMTLSGILSGSGALAKTGEGTLTLSGANTYTGGTTISEGVVYAEASNALGTGDVTIDGGHLAISGEGVTVTNSITVVLDSYIVASTDLALASLEDVETYAIVLDDDAAFNGSISVTAGDSLASLLSDGEAHTFNIIEGNYEINYDALSELGYIVSDVSSGVITITAPEPSMFGVLAGLGALGFVAARRRRNRKA